jgi:hypothetical protein
MWRGKAGRGRAAPTCASLTDVCHKPFINGASVAASGDRFMDLIVLGGRIELRGRHRVGVGLSKAVPQSFATILVRRNMKLVCGSLPITIAP